jgi:hypothetical protein
MCHFGALFLPDEENLLTVANKGFTVNGGEIIERLSQPTSLRCLSAVRFESQFMCSGDS